MRPPRLPPELHAWRMSDGYTLHGRLWQPPPDVPLRGAVLYLHGIQSHGGWFEPSAAVLAERGIAVLLPDRRGSGRNAPPRGDVRSGQRWLADLDELYSALQARWPGVETGIVGVSWGGKLAAAWSLRRPAACARLLLVTPGIFAAVDVGWAVRLRIATALLFRPAAPFEIPLSDPALFTANPAAQEFIAADTDKLTHATARFFFHSLQLDRAVQSAPRRALAPEVTLYLAEYDRIIRNEPTVAWVQRVAAHAARVHLFPGTSHTLEFEPEPAAFLDAVGGWADRFGAPGGCA